ncbi:FtsX-like permease family protein [Bifidobacterium simiarum]|uniref:FtsX-like permease family protein n=1 Tax=Bifidobacterium simiarum TaxID=2045441 RepID=UPI001BDBBB08|nr:FtsX-like permease family protein [Bifidobacterium simiarum]MBT1165744.1 FtsX-like permease family protein [Bifidobacterium simiarum]
MSSAFAKDMWRTVGHGWKRFVSIMIITALGVTMATGLKASCVDLRRSADLFFDGQDLYDVSVVSTLGLTDDDVSAIGRDVDGVDHAVGVYGEEVAIDVDGGRSKANVTALDDGNMDEPLVTDGRLPRTADEAVTTDMYLKDSGSRIGDTVTFGDPIASDDDIFARHPYTIVGTVIDPADINNAEGATAFRDNASSADYDFFVARSAVNDSAKGVYTAIHLTVRGAKDEQAYGTAYTALIDRMKTRLAGIQDDREQARTKQIRDEADADIDAEETKANREIADAQAKLDDAQAKLDGQRTLLDGQAAQLESAMGGLTVDQAAAAGVDAAVRLRDARNQLDEAQRTLDGQRREFAANRDDARNRIARARQKVDDIEPAQWYVRDRTALGGYASIDSDAKSIEAIGTAFPILFLLVAVLISLTAITRMVEEERGLIGTYKALGYRKREILRKYVVYAGLACLLGGILGDLLGFVALPKIIFTIFETMYLLPAFTLHFDWAYGLGAVALFVMVVVGSAVWACRGELRLTPAALMRPKAPKAGRKILLERVRPLWNRMSFLGKVTARNLFRYKSRALMTICGIAGCTMLLMCGFAIRDSVVALSPNQYGGVTAYDLMAVTSQDDHAKAMKALKADDEVRDVLGVRIDSATLSSAGAGSDSSADSAVDSASGREENVQLVVVPDGADLGDYIHLREAQSDWSAALGGGATVRLTDDGVAITKNAQQMLGLDVGGVAHIKDSALHGANATVDAVVENYLGNSVFMTQRLYERLYGDYHANAMLAHLDGDSAAQIRFCDSLARDDAYLSVTSTAELVRDFTKNFTLINTVVYVLLVLAGALAFVVLFTLSTTNISERERELATIKVLGFNRREVRRYVNREMIILTLIGVAVGLPLGRLAGEGLTMVLRMPSIYFAVHVQWPSYVISGVLSLAFALLVTLATNRMLDRIDMVGALKSPE